MKKNLSMMIACVCCTFNLSTVVAKTETSQSIFTQLNFFEYSVTHSSVSIRYDEVYKKQQLDLLKSARDYAESGQITTAEEILQYVAKSIFRMPEKPSQRSEASYGDIYRLKSVFNAVDAILPQAQSIVEEKHLPASSLKKIRASYRLAQLALDSNDQESASSLIESTYTDLQKIVSRLRSGDRLLIALPPANSEAGWKEAARRYEDWRYFNQHIELLMISRGQNSDLVHSVTTKADNLYDQAISIAMNKDWENAVHRIDQAYQLLLKSWRRVGVDIGI